MEITKQFLEIRKRGYQEAAEKAQKDALANFGAMDAIEQLLKEMSIQEVDRATCEPLREAQT